MSCEDSGIAVGGAVITREAQVSRKAICGTTICMLTSVHAAKDVRIYEKEALSLTAAGYRVLIIAPHRENEKKDGVEIIAVKRHKSRLQRMTRGAWEVYRQGVKVDADVYHFHDPELIPVGMLLKLRGRRVIYDVHEDVPRDIVSKRWVWKPIRNIIALAAAVMEYVGAQMFDGIVAATPAIARRFPAKKTEVVRNFPELNFLERSGVVPFEQRAVNCVYVGLICTNRGVEEMIDGISLVPLEIRPKLFLAGPYEPPELESEMSKRLGWSRVESLGWLSRPEIAELLGKVRIGLAVLHPTACFVESLPIKMFEYMAAGIPVIASDFPIWREIVHRHKCGLLVNPQVAAEIAEAISWLLNNPSEAEAMGGRGREAVETMYNWAAEEKRLCEVYQRLTAGYEE